MSHQEDVTKITTDSLSISPEFFMPPSTDELPRLEANLVEAVSESLANQPETDSLPVVKRPVVEVMPGTAKGLWRQVVRLREENRRLLAECQQLEQNNNELKQRTGVIEDHFQQALHMELQRQLDEALQQYESNPTNIPPLLQDVIRTIDRQSTRLEEKQLVETLFLKRELQQLAEHLQEEESKLKQEQERVITLQYSIRQQAALREQSIRDRLFTRWRLTAITTAISLLFCLVISQFVALALLHIQIAPALSFALLAPIVFCVLAALLFVRPAAMVRQMYYSAPHKKKSK
jgi:hypothetical protein